MSRWLELAREADEYRLPQLDTPTKEAKSTVPVENDTFCQVLSQCRVKNSEKQRAPVSVAGIRSHARTDARLEEQKPPPFDETDRHYGRTAGGRYLTWTGKVVDLEELRKLTDWELHGATGRMWSGQTRQWEFNATEKHSKGPDRRPGSNPAEPQTIKP